MTLDRQGFVRWGLVALVLSLAAAVAGAHEILPALVLGIVDSLASRY